MKLPSERQVKNWDSTLFRVNTKILSERQPPLPSRLSPLRNATKPFPFPFFPTSLCVPVCVFGILSFSFA